MLAGAAKGCIFGGRNSAAAADSLINLAAVLAVFAVFYILWRIFKVALNVASARSGADATTVSFMQTLLKYGVLAIGFISALDTAGVRTGAIIASLGIAGGAKHGSD